jgi:hypothetical protein
MKTMLFTQENAVGLHRVTCELLVKNKGQSAVPNANHCQGQLQTPQSVTILEPQSGTQNKT